MKKTANISTFLILGLIMAFFSPSFAFGALTDNLQAYYTLDDVLTDSTANDNDLTNVGSAGYSAGIINNGISLNGSSQYLTANDSASLSLTGDGTWSGWIKLDAEAGSRMVIGKGAGYDANQGYYFIYDGDANNLTMRFAKSSAPLYFNASLNVDPLPSATLFYWVATYDASEGLVEFFKNGVSLGTVNSTPTAIEDSSTVLYIGADQPNTRYYLDGIMDEIGIWNRVLSDTEITDLYNSGDGLQYPFSAGAPPPTITSIDPVSGYNNEALTGIEIAGTDFVATPAVKLVKAGESDINCTGEHFTSSILIDGITCDITGAEIGDWDIILTNPDAQYDTLSAGFEVLEYVGPSNTENNQLIDIYKSTTESGTWWQVLSMTDTQFQRDNIGGIRLKMDIDETTTYVEADLYELASCGTPYTGIGTTIFQKQLTRANGDFITGIQTLDFTGTVSATTAGKCYVLRIQGTYSGFYVYGSNSNTAYAYGDLWIDLPLYNTTDATVKDIYMEFLEVYVPPTISLIYPADDATNIPNFSHWTGSFNYNDYILGNSVPAVSVRYGTDSDHFTDIVQASNSYQLFSKSGNFEVASDILLSNTTYIAKAYLVNASTYALIAESATSTFRTASNIDFNPLIQTDTSLAYTWLNSTSTASTTPYALNATCDNQSGIINYGSCVLFSFLFTPHDSTLKNWDNLKLEIIKKPPFGYFTIYQGIINGLTTATTTSAVALADLSELSVPLLDPLKAILTMILWFLFSWSTFTRLKHLQL